MTKFYRCGEFTNAEQNLNTDGGSANLKDFGRTVCFQARIRQDIADCMCNGTRGGTRILAGQTQRSQEFRRGWGMRGPQQLDPRCHSALHTVGAQSRSGRRWNRPIATPSRQVRQTRTEGGLPFGPPFFHADFARFKLSLYPES